MPAAIDLAGIDLHVLVYFIDIPNLYDRIHVE